MQIRKRGELINKRILRNILILAGMLLFIFISMNISSGSILNFVFNNSNQLVGTGSDFWTNRTELGNTTIGVRLDSPILFMDFNENHNVKYVVDKSPNTNNGEFGLGSETLVDPTSASAASFTSSLSATLSVVSGRLRVTETAANKAGV